MEKLMTEGWRFEFFMNGLETYTCIARKDKTKIEVVADHLEWWPLITSIVAKVEAHSPSQEGP